MRKEPIKLTENGVAGGKHITHGLLVHDVAMQSEEPAFPLVSRLVFNGLGVGSGEFGVGVGVGRGGGRTGVGTCEDFERLIWIALPKIEDWMLAPPTGLRNKKWKVGR
jgi:hypothetical protein